MRERWTVGHDASERSGVRTRYPWFAALSMSVTVVAIAAQQGSGSGSTIAVATLQRIATVDER